MNRTFSEDHSELSFVSEYTEPKKEGIYALHINCWWCVHPTKGLIIYRGFSPQCNASQIITRKVALIYPWCEIKFIERAWTPYHE